MPRDWELEDEDKKAYIEYLKQLENAEDELVEEKGAYTEWMKGNSKEETKKRIKNSSQKIMPIIPLSLLNEQMSMD